MGVKKEKPEITFEEALEKLEDIVDSMEEGDLSLDAMISRFEEGSRLSKYCGAKLKGFEKKIEILTREDANGGEWTDFDPESGKRISETPSAPDDDAEENNEDFLF
jgi:exodeoxyribonuclease VII small subunit